MAQPRLPRKRGLVAYVENINRTVKLLTLDLYNRFKNDAMVYRAKERVMLASATDPVFIAETVGGYLYPYREQIYQGDESAEKFFMDNRYDGELRAGVEQEKVDLSAYIIPKIKTIWPSIPRGEQARLKEMVISVLDDYIEYLLAKQATT